MTVARSNQLLAAITVIVFAVRLAGMIASQRMMPVVAADTATYMSVARNLVSGNGFVLQESRYEASRIAPLFPLLLAANMKIAGPSLPIRLLGTENAVLRTIAVIILFFLVRMYFSALVATAAVGIYVVDPWEALWTGYILKESLAVCLFLGAIYAVARAFERPSVWRYALAGTMIGLATLARFASGTVWIAAVVLVLLQKERRVKFIAALSFAMVATLSPWLIRNWIVTGQPVLSPHFVGQKLYTSNGPGVEKVTDGYYAPKGVDSRLVRGTPQQRQQPFNKDASLGWVAVRHLLRNPGEIPTRIAAKVINMWRPTFESHSRRNWYLLGIPYLALMAVSLIGIALVIRHRVRCTAVIVTLAVFLCVHLVFRGEIRNRQYLMPLFYAFGGYAIATTIERARTRNGAPASMK